MREQLEHDRFPEILVHSCADDEIGWQRVDRTLNRQQIVGESRQRIAFLRAHRRCHFFRSENKRADAAISGDKSAPSASINGTVPAGKVAAADCAIASQYAAVEHDHTARNLVRMCAAAPFDVIGLACHLASREIRIAAAVNDTFASPGRQTACYGDDRIS